MLSFFVFLIFNILLVHSKNEEYCRVVFSTIKKFPLLFIHKYFGTEIGFVM
jgi:hypothetical protein